MTYQAPKWTHVTLPSVEQVNILRDPPKSITTRRINKVQDDNTITNLIDGSGDRVCESIRVYPRGTNPMVEVSYDNYANNAGIGGNRSNRQAYLPYRIMDGGAFRAPIIAPADLLPLSRQPRVHTFATANPGLVDFSKKLACGTNSKNNKSHLPWSVPSTQYLKKQTVQQMDHRDHIKNIVHSSANTNPVGRTKIEYSHKDIDLELNRPYGQGYTNTSGIKNAAQCNPETTVMKRQLKYSGFEGKPTMPQTEYNDQLIRTGIAPSLRPEHSRTRM